MNTSAPYKYVDLAIHFCITRNMTEYITRFEALRACRDAAGSDSQMARDLNVSQPVVWRWLNQSKQMPAEFVLTAERLYGVTRHHLRPDIYPLDLQPAPRTYLPRQSGPTAAALTVGKLHNRTSKNGATA